MRTGPCCCNSKVLQPSGPLHLCFSPAVDVPIHVFTTPTRQQKGDGVADSGGERGLAAFTGLRGSNESVGLREHDEDDAPLQGPEGDESSMIQFLQHKVSFGHAYQNSLAPPMDARVTVLPCLLHYSKLASRLFWLPNAIQPGQAVEARSAHVYA